MIAGWVAALAIVGGASCLYASTPHQILIPGGVAKRPCRFAGAALLVTALGLLLTVQGAATAVFTWMTGATAVWSIVPVALRWWRFRRDTAR